MLKSLAVVLALLVSPANAAIYDWSNKCSTWHFNPLDVRDPTIIFNNTALPVGICQGYDGTQYAFEPCNFAPQITPAMCSNGTGPTRACAGSWSRIQIEQFGIPATAKELILTGNAGISGPNQWINVIYLWFRAPGSSWALSPIVDASYIGNISVHVPVAVVDGVAGIEAAWSINGTVAAGDNGWVNLIVSGWCE